VFEQSEGRVEEDDVENVVGEHEGGSEGPAVVGRQGIDPY